MTPASIRTVRAPTTAIIEKIKGSRFIGDVAPASDEETALAFVTTIRQREPGASHHCWAYRLTDGTERSNDAGEPGGTAGPPILQRVVGLDLKDVVVVVTRYYGGTNLGTGGLIRAYGAAAAAVLAACEIEVELIRQRLHFRYSYEHSSAVEASLGAFDGQVVAATYTEEVELDVAVPVASAFAFAAALSESTAGQVKAQPK